MAQLKLNRRGIDEVIAESEKKNYPYWNNMEAQFSRLEHQAYTLGVGGSSPSASTKKNFFIVFDS